MATTLTHPALGDRSFDDDHAKRLMSLVNNGGWEFKKQAVPERKPARLSKKEDATANASTDQGDTQVSEEEGDN